MGKNSKRNNKAKQQQQQQQQAQQAAAAASGGGAASSSKSNNNNNNNKEEQNALERRFPRLSGKQRKELNQLVLQLLDLVQVQPANPNEEWTQYVQLQKLLDRITQLEEPLQKAVCPEISAGDDQQRLAKVAAFSEWAKAAGVQSEGVEIAIFPGYQLGLRATRDLAADEQVLSVPRKLIFSEEHLPESDRRLFCNYPLLTNFNLAYALVIEKVRGAESEWRPYIDLLPAKYNTVLYFSVAQMQRLRGTAAGTVALRQCRVIARQYANMYKCAHIRPEASSSDGGGSMGVLCTQHGLCYELYRWAVSTVMTRQNLVPREMQAIDEAELNQLPISALIPYWDMANHRPGKITSFYDSGTRQMDCTAQEEFKAGEQFFIYYGDRSNADLLVHNGFVDLNNRKDYVKIRLGLSPTDPLAEQRARILAKLNIDRKAELRVLPAPDFISGELLAFVRVFNMSAEQLDHWHSDLERAGDLLHIDCALETDHETRTWQYLYQRLKLLLGVFEVTLKEADEVELLSQLKIKEAAGEAAAGHEIDLMLLEYRRLERSILAGALQYAQEHCKV
ncbi:actin-histidine N-methyltransferase [Drosophila kikkawai]|uniref:protein-histidine N-methyltransferase n=1 Tax=Drosophila kikkawai TaxID=30033 RepID=A0A6P4J7A9_DROKI|nr:actin-histidine N-methyltransferase [Drosophila kikkawai]